MLGAKLRENFQANDLALVSVLVATGATVLLDSYGHLPNIAARSIQRFLQRWRWRLAYQPPNQTPMPCTIPTGKNAASAIIRGRCPFVAQKMIEVSHASALTMTAGFFAVEEMAASRPWQSRLLDCSPDKSESPIGTSTQALLSGNYLVGLANMAKG